MKKGTGVFLPRSSTDSTADAGHQTSPSTIDSHAANFQSCAADSSIDECRPMCAPSTRQRARSSLGWPMPSPAAPLGGAPCPRTRRSSFPGAAGGLPSAPHIVGPNPHDPVCQLEHRGSAQLGACDFAGVMPFSPSSAGYTSPISSLHLHRFGSLGSSPTTSAVVTPSSVPLRQRSGGFGLGGGGAAAAGVCQSFMMAADAMMPAVASHSLPAAESHPVFSHQGQLPTGCDIVAGKSPTRDTLLQLRAELTATRAAIDAAAAAAWQPVGPPVGTTHEGVIAGLHGLGNSQMSSTGIAGLSSSSNYSNSMAPAGPLGAQQQQQQQQQARLSAGTSASNSSSHLQANCKAPHTAQLPSSTPSVMSLASDLGVAPMHSGMPYEHTRSPLMTAGQTALGDVTAASSDDELAAVAAAMAEEKMAQIEQLTALQNQLRQEVITLLPLI